MKVGLEIGYTEKLTFTVTEDMFAQFDGEVVHPTYSTASMVYHMEWVSRKIILPFLEEEEEGMGAFVTVKHLAPSTLGTKVLAVAKITDIRPNSITTSVTLTTDKGMIGKGEVKQAILLKKFIQQQLEKARVE